MVPGPTTLTAAVKLRTRLETGADVMSDRLVCGDRHVAAASTVSGTG